MGNKNENSLKDTPSDLSIINVSLHERQAMRESERERKIERERGRGRNGAMYVKSKINVHLSHSHFNMIVFTKTCKITDLQGIGYNKNILKSRCFFVNSQYSKQPRDS